MGTNPGELQTNLLFANFNQDNTSLAAGSALGYRLFSLSSVEKLEPIYENATEDAYIVERLFASSLVAIVSQQHPRKLKVCHFKKGTEICNYSYAGSILSCKLNRQRLVVCLEESLYIHNIRDMKVLHNIRDTPINPTGLIALSISDENCYLAFPNSNQTGEVQIFDTINLRGVIMIPAHDNKLAALAFSPKGDKIATASEKGTVIRVFGLPDGAKLFEFRRGVKRCVSITCLSFSQDANFLCSSSNTETVHVFKLEMPREASKAEETGTWMGMIGSVVKSSASVLPAQMTDMFSQGRSFATAHLPCTGTKNSCAITTIQKLPRLLVVNLEGAMFIYNLDPNESGECQLVRQHRLNGANSEGSQGDQASADRPLTHPGSAGGGGSPGSTTTTTTTTGTTTAATYAASARRSEAAGSSAKHNHPSEEEWITPEVEPIPDAEPEQISPQRIINTEQEQISPESIPYAEPEQISPQPVPIPQTQKVKKSNKIKKTKKIESQPFQDVDQGAVGGEAGDIAGLRLDDDSEFPPMTHKND